MDLENIWRRVSGDSVLVIYQHLQPNAHKRLGDLEHRLSEIHRRLGAALVAVWHRDLAFLVVARGLDLEYKAREVVKRHAERHGLQFVESERRRHALSEDLAEERRPYLSEAKRGEAARDPADERAGMPTVSRFFGIEIRIYGRDHPPAHFHVFYAGSEAAVSIETLDLVAGSLPRRAMALSVEWAMMHRPELRENWQRAARKEALHWVRGLDEEG